MLQLNFARKWRSKNFNELVGQDLSVRILKNTLYLNHFFPVYLFSGQRGCGKTSTARIFAAAINCKKLELFRENPRTQPLPCLECISCVAIKNGSHPDFIEMDAASHTGVDNVRQIIEASSLMPVMGGKKIYLIDEAHMLSKAAFNAFLKILEEPPEGVLFILATTELHKIIDTVKSRSFQLFFSSVDHDTLLKHLQFVCEQEKISADVAALSRIIKETDGSVRDALNLLEQVRFSTGRVSQESVMSLLAHCDDELILSLAMACAAKDTQQLVSLWHERKLTQFKADSLWQSLLDCFMALIALQHGLKPTRFEEYPDELKKLVSLVSTARCTQILTIMHQHELLMAKSRNPHAILQTVLLQLCSHEESVVKTAPAVEKKKAESKTPRVIQPEANEAFVAFWQQCVSEIEQLNDPFLHSIFKQASCQAFSRETGELTISFGQKFAFFQGTLLSNEAVWKPVLDKVAGVSVTLKTTFVGGEVAQVPQKAEPIKIERPVYKPAAQSSHKKNSYQRKAQPRASQPSEGRVDVSDAEVWPKAHALMNIFPGVITEIKE